MKEYEIHISSSYNTDGGTKEWSYFTEYVNANSAAEAKRIKRPNSKRTDTTTLRWMQSKHKKAKNKS